MKFLPLTPPGQTPLRVMTIAGTDSGGGAGIQADLRTFAMLGVHGCVSVAAVTVQNSLGVKGFHEIPLDVITGQIQVGRRGHRHPGRQDGHAGVLGDHRGGRRDVAGSAARTRRGAAGGRPGVRVDARRPAAAPVGAGYPSHRTVSARHAGHPQPRRGAAASPASTSSTRSASARRPGAARAGTAVGAGQGRPPPVVVAQPRPAVRRHRVPRVRRRAHRHPATTTARATRWRRRRPARWPTATRCPTPSPSPRAGSPNACARPTRWATATARSRRCSG